MGLIRQKNGYKMKQSTIDIIKKKYRSDYIAEQVGISKNYMSMIKSREFNCSKPVAYAITKVLDKDAEVVDYFDRV